MPVAVLAVGVSLLVPDGRRQWSLSLFRQPTHYTALYFNEPSALPSAIAVGDAVTISFTIGNHEAAPVNYRYVLTASSGGASRSLAQAARVVPAGGSWTVWRVVRPACESSPCRIRVSLPGHPEEIEFGASLVTQPANQAVLPSWAIGPFARYSGNPLLAAPATPTARTTWEWPQVFNPGVVVVNDVFHMLYRGATVRGYSSIGAAVSSDGIHFTPSSANPVIRRVLPSESHGVEDPRLYYSHGTYYAFFTGYSGKTVDINEATSANGTTWRQLGPVLRNTKNAALVADPQGKPVRVNGRYLMYYGQSGGTYLAESADLVHWTRTGVVATGFPASYAPYEFCVAVTDYRTMARGPVNHNIDLFVAGRLMSQGRWYYAISEIYFKRNSLRGAAARLSVPVLYPQEPYEQYGVTPNAVFMNAIVFHRNKWWMYYGAADTVTGLATADLRRGR